MAGTPLDNKNENEEEKTISFEECLREQAIEELKAIDLNTISPYEAMQLLFGIQSKLK